MLIVGLNHTLYVSLERQRARAADTRQRGGKGGLLCLIIQGPLECFDGI
jgi:hypothetical protein